jgi:signal peptidase I
MNNSLIEPPFIPTWAQNYKETIFFIYNGPSMMPLFRPGDLLCAQKPAFENIQLGDIVIVDWRNDNNVQYVVHRIISVYQNYLITQGDNNLKSDTQLVTRENLIGRVNSFGRQNQVYSVKGGMMGLFYARLIRVRNHFWLFVKRLGWQIYRFIRQSGWAARIWHPAIIRLRVKTDNGYLVKYCHDNRTVARWWLETKKFDADKPFDLVISNPEEKD